MTKPKGRPFVKGQSGNPKGRSKKSLALQELIRSFAEAEEPGADPLSGNRLVDQAWFLAKTGDASALKLLFEYGYGKAPQKVEITNTTDYRRLTDAELEAMLRSNEQQNAKPMEH